MPRKVLGIRVGETWAYRSGARRALRPALVVNPGTHYDALIRIRLLDDPSHEDLWVRRVKLPCKWEERGEWLESHPEYRPVEPAEPVSEPEPDSVTLTIDALRRVIREEVAAAVAPPVVAYKMADAARATGVSVETLRRAMRLNELVPNYVGTKPIFRAEELQRWVRSLPDEKQR